MRAALLNSHLSACPDCAAWYEAAARVTRLARVAPAAPIPDLTAQILAAAWVSRRAHPGRLLVRVALALLGAAQVVLALPALALGADELHPPLHVAHESGAWNVALAVAFLAAALRPRYASGLLPLLAAFVAVLVAASLPDVTTGDVPVARLAEHLPVVVALLLVTVLGRADRRTPVPPQHGRSTGGPLRSGPDPGEVGWPSGPDGPVDRPAAAESRLPRGYVA